MRDGILFNFVKKSLFFVIMEADEDRLTLECFQVIRKSLKNNKEKIKC